MTNIFRAVLNPLPETATVEYQIVAQDLTTVVVPWAAMTVQVSSILPNVGYIDIPQPNAFLRGYYVVRSPGDTVPFNWSGTDPIWFDSAVPAPDNVSVLSPSPDSADTYNRFDIAPSFDPNLVSNGQRLYWDVVTQLRDVGQAVISESQASPLSSFVLSLSTDITLEGQVGGPGSASDPSLRQKDPLIPSQKPRILYHSPSPGFVAQDFSPDF